MCWGEGREVHDQLMDILGWWWGNQESTSSTFWFWLVWGLHACGQHIVNFFYPVGVSVSAKQLKGHGWEYIYSPWGETKGPWLCLVAKLLLFCLVWFFPLFLHFLTSLIKLTLWVQFFCRRDSRRTVGGGGMFVLGRPHWILLWLQQQIALVNVLDLLFRNILLLDLLQQKKMVI